MRTASYVIPCAILLWASAPLIAQETATDAPPLEEQATSMEDAPPLVAATPKEALEAARKAPLGSVQFGLNLSYIEFTDDFFDDTEDDGVYFGVLGYGRLLDGLYLGGEVGAAANIDIFGKDITFCPFELNAKYAFEPLDHLVVDFGGGLSYSYVEIDTHELFFDGEEIDDWVFGGQVFADVIFRAGWFTLGVNGKYQLAEDFEDSDVALDNWRLGAVIGVAF